MIGTGMAGSIHARSARLAGGRLVGVCASTPARSEVAADRLAAERPFDHPAALINDPEVDVVHICTPNDLHHELAGEALAARKHVICEKPLAIELAQAEELARLAARQGVLAATPFVYRYYPMVRQARALVEAGELGDIALLSGSYLQDWLMPRASSNWRVERHRGGPSRAFADIGSHWCDLVEYVSGEKIAALSAQTRTVLGERPPVAANTPSFATEQDSRSEAPVRPVDTEDAAVVLFNTARGAAGTTLVSQVSAGHKNHLSFELTGARGTVRFDQQAPDTLLVGREHSLEIVERDPERLHPSVRPYATLPAGHPQGYHDCFDAFVRDAYESISAGSLRDGLPTFEDGVRAVALTSAVLRSSKASAAWVDVDPAAFSSINDRQTGLDLSAADGQRGSDHEHGNRP